VAGFTQEAGKPAAAPAAQPWPDEHQMEERRKEAESRTLFAADSVIEFTLTADFRAVNRDRNPNSTKVFPATMTVAKADGSPVTFPLNIRTRGHSRRMVQTCSFAPLRLEFKAEDIKGTIFEGHKNLKLGTHCRDVDLFEQYVPKEYAAYRIFNLLTPRSFRVRLAKGTYVDAEGGKVLDSRVGMFIEDDDDVARRLGGRVIEPQKTLFRRVDQETLTMMMLFEYMIGNTDMSMYELHNVVMVNTPSTTWYPVPYDFDYSGLVDARYAIPAKQFNLTSVKDRLYRGPCRSATDLEPYFQKMQAAKPQILALFDTIPYMDDNYRKDSKKYLERFYETISKPSEVKKAFVDGCDGRPGM
jgi:hypothetical protein